MAKLFFLGSGGWGMALAIMCSKNGHEVTLWSPFQEEIAALRRDRENAKLLPGVRLPDEIELTNSLERVGDADVVVLAVPSFAVGETAQRLHGQLLDGTVVVNVAKGLEEDSLRRLSEVISEELPHCRVAALSGPSHAEEVSRGMPTTVVAASLSGSAALLTQDVFMNPKFRIYINHDLVGVELGGALKNSIALAAGICDGMEMGDNTKAALMTRGMTEIARLGVALGGKTATFAGLSGMGDLIVTCTSMHSRNRRAGIYIGQGFTAKEAVEKVGMTVEGYRTTLAAWRLAKKAGVEMPIVNECYQVLYEGKDPHEAIGDLMMRQRKHEIEDIWM